MIRHLIGLPAGLVRLHYGWYSLATLAGAALWCSVLAYVGVKAGEDAALLQGDLSRLSLWLIGTALVVGALFYFRISCTKSKLLASTTCHLLRYRF